ncbi:MAG: hypothetical protein PF693_04205 [Spirochaetia bacterium]|jgi:hypothetical protein|nr:hypothetical protein [Spirochaetia bacterium]
MGTIDIRMEYGFDLFFNLVEDEEFEDYKKPNEIVTFLDRSLRGNETAELSPHLKLNTKSIELIRIVNEKLGPYVTEAGIKFITGEMDIDKDWNSYLSELRKRGYKASKKYGMRPGTIKADKFHSYV